MPKVVSTKNLKVQSRKSPAQLLLESLDGDYKTMGDMAKRYGVHIETMRRLCKSYNDDGTKKVLAPSEAVINGGMTIYLFTKKDVKELDSYFKNKGYLIKT
jgi:hypothetical protein